jgi:hypothetical protein
MQVPVLAYKENANSLQPHSIYESIICNEFLEVVFACKLSHLFPLWRLC